MVPLHITSALLLLVAGALVNRAGRRYRTTRDQAFVVIAVVAGVTFVLAGATPLKSWCSDWRMTPPLSGLDERSGPFFHTVAASPALTARARAIAADLEQALDVEHQRSGAASGPAVLLAPFFVAGYTSVLVASARRLLSGDPAASVPEDHRARLERLYVALRQGVALPR